MESKHKKELCEIMQEIYPLRFSNYKIRLTKSEVQDITDENHQEEIIVNTRPIGTYAKIECKF